MKVDWGNILEEAIGAVIAAGFIALVVQIYNVITGDAQASSWIWIGLAAFAVSAIVALAWRTFGNVLSRLGQQIIHNWQLVVGSLILFVVAYGAYALTQSFWPIGLAIGLVLAIVVLLALTKRETRWLTTKRLVSILVIALFLFVVLLSGYLGVLKLWERVHVTPTAIVSNVTPTPTLEANSTATPTPTETSYPTPTKSISPILTPSATPLPITSTATPTSTLTPPSTPTMPLAPTSTFTPSPTPTSPVRLLPPVTLLGPDDGSIFAGKNSSITLKWDGSLQDDQYYFVHATFTGVNQERVCQEGWVYFKWTKEDSFLVDPWLYDTLCPSFEKRSIQWTVRVGQPTNGIDQQAGKQLSLDAHPREFTWALGEGKSDQEEGGGGIYVPKD